MNRKRKTGEENLPNINGKKKKGKTTNFSEQSKHADNIVSDIDINQMSFNWQWEMNDNDWKAYSDEQQKIITTGLKANKKQIQIMDETNTQIAIDVEKMTQKNDRVEQKIRCWAQLNEDDDWFCWKWEDENGEEHYYSSHNTANLENARIQKLSDLVLKIGRKNFNIDLQKYVQIAASKKSEISKITRINKSSTNIKTISKVNKTNSVIKPSEEQKEKIESKITTGKPPVDSECKQKIGKAHVFTEDEDVYDVMLNQTNLQFNNNKYYVIQLLKDNNSSSYSVWMRWGRVGKKGQNSLVQCGSDLEKAKLIFQKKFSDKTKNIWEERHQFQKVPGKYDLLQMDYSDVPDSKEIIPKPSKLIPESKLNNAVKALVEMICDLQAMEETVMEMKYDTKKAPLGKLTSEQIKAGYVALKQIEDLIMKNVKGKKIIEACNDFYTRIPHDFGMKTPPLISTLKEMKCKLQLLEALGDIEIAVKLLNEDADWDLNPIDRHYKALECDLTPLEPSNKDYQIIEKYIANTHAKTHNQYTLNIQNIFVCNKNEEQFEDFGNRVLLWHGSRLTNWVGILSRGLRIAPPEAPVTGYMFGKGIYFADMCSKSANYCFATRSKNTGLILLCEVSLGKCNKLIKADYDGNKLPKGKHSVMGLGRIMPNPDEDVYLSDGTRVPLGIQIETNIKNSSGYTLNYNEYVVYNPKQIRMRYLVEAKFCFK